MSDAISTTAEPKTASIMVVDDEDELRHALCEMLNETPYRAVGYSNGQDALEALETEDFDLLLTDLTMPGMHGTKLIQLALTIDPNLVPLVMTGQATIESAVDSLKTGAFDYVLKPFKLRDLLSTLRRAVDLRRLRLENIQLREAVAIHELSQAIAHTLDMNLILNKVAEAACEQCEADEASVMLPTRDGRELYVATVRGEGRETLLGKRVPVAGGIAGWAIRHGQPLTLHGPVSDERFQPLHPREGICSSVCMPMMVGGKPVGVLSVNAVQRQRSFTLGQVKGLGILASTAASALEGVRLHGEVSQAEQKYRSIFDNVAIGIAMLSPEREVLEVNRQMRKWFPNVDPGERPRCQDALCHAPDPSACAQCPAALALSDGQVHDEVRSKQVNGEAVSMRVVTSPLLDGDDRVAGVVLLMENITERLRAELERQNLLRLHETTLDMVPSCLLVFDWDLSVLMANRCYLDMADLSADQVVGRSIEVLPPRGLFQDESFRGRIAAVARAGGDDELSEARCVFPGQGERCLDIRICGVHSPTGRRREPRVLVAMEDVTERRRLAGLLRQPSKMETVG